MEIRIVQSVCKVWALKDNEPQKIEDFIFLICGQLRGPGVLVEFDRVLNTPLNFAKFQKFYSFNFNNKAFFLAISNSNSNTVKLLLSDGMTEI